MRPGFVHRVVRVSPLRFSVYRAAVATERTGRDVIPLRTATKVWLEISLQSFGGPAGQIAVMQHKLVDEKRWIGQRRFLHALSFCMLLPGPEAQQLAVYTGWLLNGTRGGLVAGALFVLPGMLALLVLSWVYVAFGDAGLVDAVFSGIAPAVIAIVVQAVLRVGRRSLDHPVLVGLAVAAFLALTLFAVPFPAVVLGAGLLAWVLSRRFPDLTLTRGRRPDDGGPPSLISDDVLHHELPTRRRTLAVLGIGLSAWFAPVVAVGLLVSSTPVFLDMGLFFSGAAVVTFGGAYAVLAYVAQQAVGVYAWLTPGEMVRGLALAETTPGPLIMVLQFVAFVGAYRSPGDLNPWLAAVLASLLVTWVTFVPSFLFVFLGAPLMERLRDNRHLTAALNGITAAVVGVIANLAVFFALHNLFRTVRVTRVGPLRLEVPDPGSWAPVAFGITGFALVAMLWRGWGTLRTLGACALIGLAVYGVRLVA